MLLDLALRDVVAHTLVYDAPGPAAAVRAVGEGWEVSVAGSREPVRGPRARAVRARARPLGADTHSVLAERARAC